MTAGPQLDRLQNSVVTMMFDCVQLHDPVEPLEFGLTGDFGGLFCACIGTPEDVDEAVFVVFTLPRYGSTVFLGLTRGKEREVARLLANLEDLERERSRALGVGETIGLDIGGVLGKAFPPPAVILLPVATSSLLSRLPPKADLAGREVRFALAVPLSEQELRCLNAEGLDALLDLFQQTEKSLFLA